MFFGCLAVFGFFFRDSLYIFFPVINMSVIKIFLGKKRGEKKKRHLLGACPSTSPHTTPVELPRASFSTFSGTPFLAKISGVIITVVLTCLRLFFDQILEDKDRSVAWPCPKNIARHRTVFSFTFTSLSRPPQPCTAPPPSRLQPPTRLRQHCCFPRNSQHRPSSRS